MEMRQVDLPTPSIAGSSDLCKKRPSVTEAESSRAWTEFLQSYAEGRFSPWDIPPLPPLPANDGNEGDNGGDEGEETESPGGAADPSIGSSFDCPVYSSVEITPSIAARVREFYHAHSFLPPPRAPLEYLREQCIVEYDLYSEQQTKNIRAATDLIQAFFGGLCTFSLFRDNVQELMAVSGAPEVIEAVQLFPGKRLLPETSLCGHSVLLGSKNLYIPNLARDWRYCGNPYADELKGVKSYFGSVVSLHVDPSSSTDDRLVGIGVINIMQLDRFMPQPTDEQVKVVHNITAMLETQLRATWDGQGRTREAKLRRAISDFIEDTLVQPGLPAGASADAKATGSIKTDVLASYAQPAADRIRAVVEELDGAIVVDLRSLHPIRNASSHMSYSHSPEEGSPSTLGWASSSGDSVRPDFTDETGLQTVLSFLRSNGPGTVSLFVRDRQTSGFEPYLPASTSSHCILPFFTSHQPLFLIIVYASRQFHSVRASESNFLQSIGALLRAQVLQARVLEADAAKTAFLSSISHELRTPMHGVLAGMQLVRQSIVNGDYGEVDKILSMTEASGHALQQILNDVLDFGTLTEGNAKTASKRHMIDLANVAMAAATTCPPGPDVELVVELEERNWRAEIDEAGFQRILLNGLTNAVKFTKTGRITLSLSASVDNESVTCRITDTGPGIDPQFSRRVFEPFTKADSFTPGAGLGLFITRSLAARMDGSISLSTQPSGGALFQAVLPVTLSPHSGTPKVVATTVKPRVNPDPLVLAAQAMQLSPMSEQPSPLETSTAVRVLLADDNDIGRRILAALLEQIGRKEPVEVVQGVDGVEALDLFRQYRPHLVLTDVSMPRMDGITAASEMRAWEAKHGRRPCRIYAVTGLGSSDPRLRTEALRGSAALDGWLIKGQVKLSRIKEIVAEVRDSRRRPESA